MATIESSRRSLVKALSYRALGTCYTMLVVFVLTGEEKLSIAIGILDSIGKIIGYFLHERVWSKIKFGIVEEKRPDYEI
jgi:adenylylsulfate kinase